MKEKVIGNSQTVNHRFTSGELRLTSLVDFSDKLTRFEDGRIAAHVIDFSKALVPQYSFVHIRTLWF